MRNYFYLPVGACNQLKQSAVIQILLNCLVWFIAGLVIITILILPLAYGYHRRILFIELDEQLFICVTCLGLLGVKVLSFHRPSLKLTYFSQVQAWVIAFVVGTAGLQTLVHINNLWRFLELLLVCWLWPSVVVIAIQRPIFALLKTSIVIAAISQSLIAGYQFFTVGHRSFVTIGTLFNAGSLGNYLALSLPWLLSITKWAYQVMSVQVSSNRARLYFYAYLSASGIVISALALTGARAAWLGALLGSGLILSQQSWQRLLAPGRQYWQRGLRQRLFILTLCFIAGGTGLWALVHINESSVYGRWQIYTIGTTLFTQHPWWGIGWGRAASQYNEQQAYYFATHHVPVAKQLLATDTYRLFNSFLEASVEVGLMGSIGWVIGFFFLLQLCRRRYQQTWPAETVGAVGALLSVGICSLFSYPFHVLPIVCQAGVMLAFLPTSLIQQVPNISYKRWLLRSSLLTLLIGQLLYQEWQRRQAMRYWQHAALLAQQNHFIQASPLYELAYPVLRTEGYFLYNYGVEAGLAGQAQRSIYLLEATRPYYTSSALYTYLGQAYENTHCYQEAMWCYQHACYMTPARFYPKYKLFNLYCILGKYRLAREIGQIIMVYPVKVDNKQTRKIKYIVQQALRTDFLNKKHHQL